MPYCKPSWCPLLPVLTLGLLSLVNTIKAPLVWAPLLAIVLVLIGVSVPHLLDSALTLIG